MTYSALNIQRRGHGVALEAAASKFTMQTKMNEKQTVYHEKSAGNTGSLGKTFRICAEDSILSVESNL